MAAGACRLRTITSCRRAMSSSSSDARLRTRNESRETGADRKVIMRRNAMAVVPENPQSFSTLHSFEQGQAAPRGVPLSRSLARTRRGGCDPVAIRRKRTKRDARLGAFARRPRSDPTGALAVDRSLLRMIPIRTNMYRAIH
jgi:hypothetical protein